LLLSLHSLFLLAARRKSRSPLKLRLPLLLPLLKPLRLPLRLLPPLKPLRLLPPPLKPLRLLPRLALPPKTLQPLLPPPKRSNLLSSDEKPTCGLAFLRPQQTDAKKPGHPGFLKNQLHPIPNLLELLKQQTQNLAG
jgi:hypothetical protein